MWEKNTFFLLIYFIHFLRDKSKLKHLYKTKQVFYNISIFLPAGLLHGLLVDGKWFMKSQTKNNLTPSGIEKYRPGVFIAHQPFINMDKGVQHLTLRN